MTAEEILSTQRLMQAVILQAIGDAIGSKTDSRRPNRIEIDKRLALRWFEEAGPDFEQVCEGAGLHPAMVRSLALAFIASSQPMPRIARDQFPARHRNPLSASSIAAHAGVSVTAVRNVLKHDMGSPNMKDLVRKTAQDLANQHRIAA